MAEIGKNIDLAARLLREGKLVAIPTETVYGLAALATNENAVLSVFEAKKRPHFDPLIVHLPSIDAIGPYAELKNPVLIQLARAFWPGPLTLLLPKKESIPDLVTSGLNQVAIRIPQHSLTLELLRKLGAPLAAPSANPFGYVSPTEPSHVEKQLGDKVAYILDGGVCNVGLESTIVGMEGTQVCVYRLGGLSLEEIERIAGKVELKVNQSGNPKVPGQLKSHYAPLKPLFMGELSELLQKNTGKTCSILCFGKTEAISSTPHTIFNLSPSSNYKEAALRLFKFLRLADESDSDCILCQKLPDEDLGRAINDRLLRASVNED